MIANPNHAHIDKVLSCGLQEERNEGLSEKYMVGCANLYSDGAFALGDASSFFFSDFTSQKFSNLGLGKHISEFNIVWHLIRS